jgi:hypothetical protein
MNADICHNRTVPPWRRLAGSWALGLNATPKHAAKGAKGDGVGGNGCGNARPGGGLGTKIHLAADRRCRPVSRILSPGRAGQRAPIAPGPAIARPLKSGAAAIPSRPALSRCGNHHDPVMTSYLPPSSPRAVAAVENLKAHYPPSPGRRWRRPRLPDPRYTAGRTARPQRISSARRARLHKARGPCCHEIRVRHLHRRLVATLPSSPIHWRGEAAVAEKCLSGACSVTAADVLPYTAECRLVRVAPNFSPRARTCVGLRAWSTSLRGRLRWSSDEVPIPHRCAVAGLS